MAREEAHPTEVQKSLKGLDYPASGQDLIDHASDNGQNEKVVKLLKKIPDKKYSSPVDVSRAVGNLV